MINLAEENVWKLWIKWGNCQMPQHPITGAREAHTLNALDLESEHVACLCTIRKTALTAAVVPRL